jgi:hypothetical protein
LHVLQIDLVLNFSIWSFLIAYSLANLFLKFGHLIHSLLHIHPVHGIFGVLGTLIEEIIEEVQGILGLIVLKDAILSCLRLNNRLCYHLQF